MNFKIERSFLWNSRGHLCILRLYAHKFKVSLSIHKRPFYYERHSDELILTLLFIRYHYLRGNYGFKISAPSQTIDTQVKSGSSCPVYLPKYWTKATD